MKDSLKVKGHIDIVLRDVNGDILDERHIDNLVVTAGKNYLAAWLAAASQSGKFMSYVGLGEGMTAADVADVDLEDPLATRVLGTLSSSTNVWQNIAVFGAGVDTGAVTEAGLFSVVTSGTLFAHQVFDVINKGASDSLQITWQVTLG
jgi:hypothetical protein